MRPERTGLTPSGGHAAGGGGGGAAGDPGRTERLALLAFVVLAATGLALHGLHAAGAFGGGPIDGLVTDWLYCGLYALAAAACLRHALGGDARVAWSARSSGWPSSSRCWD